MYTVEIGEKSKKHKFYTVSEEAASYLVELCQKESEQMAELEEFKHKVKYNADYISERISKFVAWGCNRCVSKYCNDCVLTEVIAICQMLSQDMQAKEK